MRSVQSETNGAPSKGQREHDQQLMRDSQKGVRNVTSGHEQGLSDEEESRINEDLNDGRTELVEAQPVSHILQEQGQGPQVAPGQVVRWERFLPLGSLKVLLVENDYSTRHVVSALLRNCSYEVTAVENGLEAWKILEDLTSHIDLVLAEVDIPSMSGIGLLSKITNHRTRNNLPVIMMSSNDSMSIVFKCLSKGAADFLVKPIRKNELKNLWQHVWRKCHSSSGSGSESGIRTEKSKPSKGVEGSENDTDSIDDDDNGSIGLNVRDGSDNGSGTQSSWSKRAVEIDSPQPMLRWDDIADPPGSTCAQVIHSRSEVLCINQAPTTVRRECQRLDNERDNVEMCEDLNQGAPKHLELQFQGSSHKVTDRLRGIEKDNKPFDLESRREGKNPEREKVDLNDEPPQNLLNNDAGPEVAAIDIMTPQMESLGNEVPSHPSTVSNIRNMATFDTKEFPSLELSLKQLRDVSDTGTSAKEHKMLRHSDLSAFSRYNNAKVVNPAPTGNVGSCSPIDNSSGAAKAESMHNFISNSSSTPNARSNGSSNNIDMGSTTNNVSIKPEALADRSTPKSAVNIHQASAFQPVQQGHISSIQHVSTSEPSSMNRKVQVQHHHHHYHHHHHHHVHNMQQQQQEEQQQLSSGGLSSMNIVGTTPSCAPSDIFASNIEGNAANYGSASGSNNGSGQNGSSGQHDSSTALIAEDPNLTSDNGEAGKSGAGCGSGSGSGSRSEVDQNRLAQREAALNKFRQKRKERCFDKKVRYQSRKKLAEQRPRVKGQFVRQATDENKRKEESNDADS